MDLLSLPYELQLNIYFYSLNFDGLVNLTKSLKFIMLICKNCNNLLLSQGALNFWGQICRRFQCNYNDIIDPKIIWSYFDPQRYITFKELDKETLMLHKMGEFATESAGCKLPSSILDKKINDCGIKVNNDIDLIISPSSKFIAINENSHITVYEETLFSHKFVINLNFIQIFESYK